MLCGEGLPLGEGGGLRGLDDPERGAGAGAEAEAQTGAGIEEEEEEVKSFPNVVRLLREA